MFINIYMRLHLSSTFSSSSSNTAAIAAFVVNIFNTIGSIFVMSWETRNVIKMASKHVIFCLWFRLFVKVIQSCDADDFSEFYAEASFYKDRELITPIIVLTLELIN